MGDLVNELLWSLFQTVLSRVGGLVHDAIWMFAFLLITADPANSQTPLVQEGHPAPGSTHPGAR